MRVPDSGVATGRRLRLAMTEPQAEMFCCEDKYPLFLAGFGSGKTNALVDCAIRDGLTSSKAVVACYEPTYDLVRLILAPRLEQKLTDAGIRYKYNKQENIVYTSSPQCGDFVLRTLENPARIVGYESFRAHVDELDTLKEKQAELAWNKIVARNRQKLLGVAPRLAKNRISAYTTPEGFRFTYKRWEKNPKAGYRTIRATTYSNPYLPDDYIDGLLETYPAQLVKAYILGRYVNLTAGSVYPLFDRVLNHTDDRVRKGDTLHVGMDFNVLKMAAIVNVFREGEPRAVHEFVKVRDTPTMIDLIKATFPGHQVAVYPDAAGKARHSTGIMAPSDHAQLANAGFTVLVKDANPPVKDRVASVNAMICDGKGRRRFRVNTDQCPTLTECLEQQPYDEHGEPDKQGDLDHPPDALGYFMWRRFPIVRPQFDVQPLEA